MRPETTDIGREWIGRLDHALRELQGIEYDDEAPERLERRRVRIG